MGPTLVNRLTPCVAWVIVFISVLMILGKVARGWSPSGRTRAGIFEQESNQCDRVAHIKERDSHACEQ